MLLRCNFYGGIYMIEERHCSYEVARLLKEKGFDEACTCLYYNGDLEFVNDNAYEHVMRNSSIANKDFITAPTHQMACDWLMTKGIYICPIYRCFQEWKKNAIPYFKWQPTILSLTSSFTLYPQPLDMCEHFDIFGEAVDFCIKYSLENLI